MSFLLRTPPLPALPLEKCSDKQRKIAGGPCWDLAAAQGAVSSGSLTFAASPKAGSQSTLELNWGLNEIRSFFLNLHSQYYLDSEWVLPPPPGMPADTYLMSFGQFNLIRHPCPGNVYFKFVVRETAKKIFVHSCHPARY